MKLQVKPDRWSCSVTAWAMALDIPVGDAIDFIGHNGSDIIFPDLDEPMCRRGFHQQELVELALWCKVYPTPFQILPSIESECGQSIHDLYSHVIPRFEAFQNIIESTSGVLEGRGIRCYHTVAYDHGRIFNPDGWEFAYSLENCESQGFYGKQLWIFN